jgi:transposase
MPIKLAGLCNRRVRNSRETVAKSLEGDYRVEPLFALRQSLDAYRFYQRLMAEADQELELRCKNFHVPKERPRKGPLEPKNVSISAQATSQRLI